MKLASEQMSIVRVSKAQSADSCFQRAFKRDGEEGERKNGKWCADDLGVDCLLSVASKSLILGAVRQLVAKLFTLRTVGAHLVAADAVVGVSWLLLLKSTG